jgi:hypothetical protein
MPNIVGAGAILGDGGSYSTTDLLKINLKKRLVNRSKYKLECGSVIDVTRKTVNALFRHSIETSVQGITLINFQ